MKKILITAPLQQEIKIFEEYQKGLDSLIIPEGYAAERFFVVNNCDEIIPHIRNAKHIIWNHQNVYEKTHNDHLWTLENMLNMGHLRNLTIGEALLGDYDYWFSVDTDIVLHPETLQWLIRADKDIVSEIFWTMAPNGHDWCNAWMVEQSSGMDPGWRNPGLYPCGRTRACVLVKRKVLDAGVDYTQIPNILHALRGEDRHFCVRAAAHGFELWVDSHVPARHLYTEAEYQKYMEEKRRETC